METIKKQDLIDYLNARIKALDEYIADHRRIINDCEQDRIQVHLETIGKLQARKDEVVKLILKVNKISLGIDAKPEIIADNSDYSIKMK